MSWSRSDSQFGSNYTRRELAAFEETETRQHTLGESGKSDRDRQSRGLDEFAVDALGDCCIDTSGDTASNGWASKGQALASGPFVGVRERFEEVRDCWRTSTFGKIGSFSTLSDGDGVHVIIEISSAGDSCCADSIHGNEQSTS